MFNKLFNAIFSKNPLLNLGLVVSVGLVTTSASPLLAKGLETVNLKEQTETATSSFATILEDGIHLYGETSEPNQIGKEYFVFEVNSGDVTGVVYYPRSEFACVYGKMNSQQMNLTLIDPFEQAPYNYSVALQDQSLVASAFGQAPGSSVELEGYHRVREVSDNDLRMLNECRSN